MVFQCDSHNRNSEHRVMSGIITRSQDVWLAEVVDENKTLLPLFIKQSVPDKVFVRKDRRVNC